MITKEICGIVYYCGGKEDPQEAWAEVLKKLYDYEMKTVNEHMLAFGEGYDKGYRLGYETGFDKGYKSGWEDGDAGIL